MEIGFKGTHLHPSSNDLFQLKVVLLILKRSRREARRRVPFAVSVTIDSDVKYWRSEGRVGIRWKGRSFHTHNDELMMAAGL